MGTKIFLNAYLRLYAKRKVTGERKFGRSNCCVTGLLRFEKYVSGRIGC
jgi:hypothetical protein